MVDWFLSDRGQRSGPFPTRVVVQKVVSREIGDGALVWKEGMPDWQPLLAHFKAPAMPKGHEQSEAREIGERGPSIERDLATSLTSLGGAQKVRSGSFVPRYWRGDIALPISYWIVGFLGSFACLALILVLQGVMRAQEYDPKLVILSIGATWFVAGAWGIFQLVGIWRSAAIYRQNRAAQQGRGFWGILAQLATLGGATLLAGAFVTLGLPQLSESWKIAFQNDPSVPDYTLRVMRNGTELEVSGGFKYGLASDVEKVLAASPQVKVVHLNSKGGRIGEAVKLGRLIRSRNLMTYTSSQCLSACGLAFAAGSERWLKNGAELGYHGGSFAGRDSPDAMSRALLEAGIEASFVARAVSYPSAKMWYPTVPELRAARIITGTADEYRFAASGYGLTPGTEDFKQELRRASLFRAIELAAPRVFREIAEEFQRGYSEGLPEGALLDQLRGSRITPLITARLAVADNKTGAAYAALLADQYEALGGKDAKLCYDFALTGATTRSLSLFSADLRKREMALTEQALTTTYSGPKLTNQQLEALYRKVFQKIVVQYGADSLKLIDTPEKIPVSQYPLYCRVITAMFREISNLPVAEAGDVMRAIFSNAAAAMPKK